MFITTSNVLYNILIYLSLRSTLSSNENLNKTYLLYDGFIIQGFNFLWTIFPLVYIIMNDNHLVEKINLQIRHSITMKWNLLAIMSSLIFIYFGYDYLKLDDQLLVIISILFLNYLLFTIIDFNIRSFIACSSGIILYLLWIFLKINYDNIII